MVVLLVEIEPPEESTTLISVAPDEPITTPPELMTAPVAVPPST